MPRIRRFSPALGAVLIAAGLQAGCSSLSAPWSSDNGEPAQGSGNGKQIEIRSDPAGAEVLANGRSIGVTPVTVSPDNVWSTGLKSAKDYGVNFQFVGTLTIRMPGCKEYQTEVDDHLLRNDVAVKLECGPDYRPVSAAPSRQATPAYAPTTGGGDYRTSEEIMARRLRRLEGLRNRGLVTEDEYQQVRRRILGEL